MKPAPVTRLRREQTGVDAYQNPVYEDVASELPPALFAPGGSTEPVQAGRAPVITEPTLYWRNQWPDVHEGDRLQVRGRPFRVEGVPAHWEGSTVGGLVVTLKSGEG